MTCLKPKRTKGTIRELVLAGVYKGDVLSLRFGRRTQVSWWGLSPAKTPAPTQGDTLPPSPPALSKKGEHPPPPGWLHPGTTQLPSTITPSHRGPGHGGAAAGVAAGAARSLGHPVGRRAQAGCSLLLSVSPCCAVDPQTDSSPCCVCSFEPIDFPE